jgi:hypothetical protein
MKQTGSQSKPTKIEAKLPAGVQLAGPWQGPEPKKLSDGAWVYEKDVLFTNLLNGVSNGCQRGKRSKSRCLSRCAMRRYAGHRRSSRGKLFSDSNKEERK